MLLSVFKFYDKIEAELAKERLTELGIPSFLKSDDAGGVLPHLTFSNGIDLMINEEDYDRALKILS